MRAILKYSPFRTFFVLAFIVFCSSSCLQYQYNNQYDALVPGVDVDQTIKVARDEMKKKEDPGQSLGIWVLKDQVLTPKQAREISKLYLANIDSMISPFNIWHSSWAIANMYRFGNKEVKAELEIAYQKAKKQPERIQDNTKAIAENHINGEKMTTGFIHVGGYYYALGHLVVPGDKKYIQSYDDYHNQTRTQLEEGVIALWGE